MTQNKLKLITLTSDFGKQTQGVGNMEAIAYSICPDAKVVHLMHGIPDCDIVSGARAIETVRYIPVGYHICVVDPGVGTKRRGIIIQTRRGDYLIGPDNGVLIPIATKLGINKVVEITNEKYMIRPVSPIFHGRHVFTPAAAYLASGVKIEEFGKVLNPKYLVKGPYEEAKVLGNKIECRVIHINKFGSLHLNVSQIEFDKLNIKLKDKIKIIFKNKNIILPYTYTFGDVIKDDGLIMKDDYGRIEIAINMGNFAKKHKVKLMDKIIIEK